MRPTGMPVQSATTLAMALASTLGKISGDFALELLSSFSCSCLQFGEQLVAFFGGEWRALGLAARPGFICVRLRLRSVRTGGAELGAQFENFGDQCLFLVPMFFQVGERLLFLRQLFVDFGDAALRGQGRRRFRG